jgi:hypothetical protein
MTGFISRRSAAALPRNLDLDFLGDFEGIVDLNP